MNHETASLGGSSAALGMMLQTSDSMFPTGGYAHSLGLEGLALDGVVAGADTFHAFLEESLIPRAVHVDMPFTRLAHELASGGDLDGLRRLGEEYGAMQSTREIREASVRMGRQRFALLKAFNTHVFLDSVEEAMACQDFEAHEAIVMGVQGGICGWSVKETLTCAFYLTLALQINAVVKLIKIGQMQCQRILSEFLKRSDVYVERSLEIAKEDIGWFTPVWDVCSARHELAYSRIFVS